MKLRAELLRRELPEGGLALWDPLLQRITRLSAGERADLEADRPTPALERALAAALLLEGPAAEAVRERAWGAALQGQPAPAGCAEEPPLDPSQPGALPEGIAPAWRAVEPWRRLREERLAGAARLRLPGLVEPTHLAQALEGVVFTRMDTALVHAWRGEAPAPLAALLGHPALRALFGVALGRALPAGTVLNAWRMGPGDYMAVHPDGPRYHATFSLGLNPAWTAAQGGAIAFGTPSATGLQGVERWLPHAGDLLLFAPQAESWHCVEPVQRGERLTLTGWAVAG